MDERETKEIKTKQKREALKKNEANVHILCNVSFSLIKFSNRHDWSIGLHRYICLVLFEWELIYRYGTGKAFDSTGVRNKMIYRWSCLLELS